jgi:hypothetical protein
MTTTPQLPGWYPSPSGTGQTYWDGQQWSGTGSVAPQQQIDPNVLRQAMAENRSIWVTNGLAAWSLIAGLVGLLLDFLFGVGIGPAIVGVIVGFLAVNKSKKTGQGRGLALGGLITSGAAFLVGFIVIVTIFGALGSLGS